VAQPEGTRGSLKWLQRAIEQDGAMLRPVSLSGDIRWVSPLRVDDFAEYRDAAFLDVIGQGHLKTALADFWPRGGPQWDALGLMGDKPILVEAKAHIDEFFSPASQASERSLTKIRAALDSVSARLGAREGSDWTKVFFQYTNRIAHLDFLRAHNVDAHLLFVSFINDEDMNGPNSSLEWSGVFRSVDYALGLPKRHPLRPYIHHVFPDVNALM
tara:strand:+ start:140 stop:781 length:642 start_codon:yes stop_codon:yes gene_type:complete